MAKQQIVELSNGAVLIYQKQGAFNGSSFVVGFVGGAQLDGKYEGISHLLEHLLFRPASEDIRQNIMTSIMSHSIGQNAFTSDSFIAVSASATKENFARAIDNCVTMLKPTGFTTEQIKKEIEIVKHEIALDVPEQNNIVDMFLDRLAGYDISDAPRDTILGTARTLGRVTPELLSEYVRRYFNTDNLVISVTSNSPLKEIVDLCEKKIVSQFSPAEKPEYIAQLQAFPEFEPRNYLMAFPSKASSNVDIQMLLRTRDGQAEDIDKEFAYDVVEQYLNNVIGGEMWNALRVKKSLVYSYGQTVMELGNVKFKNFTAETNAKKMNATIRTLCSVVNGLATKGVDPETFEIVKKSITDTNNASLNKYKSATALSNFCDYIEGNEFVDYKRVTKIIESMTAEDFNAHLKEEYQDRNISLLVTGDFRSRDLPDLIQVEEEAGKTTNSKNKDLLNTPRVEFTACSAASEEEMSALLSSALAQVFGGGEPQEGEVFEEEAVTIGIDDEIVGLLPEDGKAKKPARDRLVADLLVENEEIKEQ